MKNILVTGGFGYIGSHVVLELIRNGYNPIVVDSSDKSSKVAENIYKTTGHKIRHYFNDINDVQSLNLIFSIHHIDAVIHLAALKAVGDSVSQPLDYYRNNVTGTINLLEVMRTNNVKNFLFSSSATVYGDISEPPYNETHPMSSTNPYGTTKVVVEGLLKELSVSDKKWNLMSLRYFNPVGADESGLFGENLTSAATNLMAIVLQVVKGDREAVTIFGDQYPTVDGTAARDYIHVSDLARGHVNALTRLLQGLKTYEVYNLGTGESVTVKQLLDTFTETTGHSIPYNVGAERPGDVAVSLADPTSANTVLGWKAEKTLKQMCLDSYNYVGVQTRNL